MGLDYIPHQGRSFLGVTKSFVTSGARSNKQTKQSSMGIEGKKGLIRLAYLDLEKLEKPAHAKSYTADTWSKGADYPSSNDGCSSFLIRRF